jgi:hypothetical protein
MLHFRIVKLGVDIVVRRSYRMDGDTQLHIDERRQYDEFVRSLHVPSCVGLMRMSIGS